jgi:hypothetical protein
MPVSGCDPNRSQDEKSMLRLTSEPVRIPTATTPDAKMTSYSSDELKEILRLHALWLDGNAEGAQANLCGADLRGADFRDADFRDANLRDANLRDADLRNADLSEADLRDADLRGADFRGADFRYANLRDADFRYADLRYADLSEADLRDADLRGADFRGADFRYANLRDADFRYADLRYAGLSEADLRDALGIPIAEDAPARLLAVAHAALAAPDALEMGTWHTCETTHCICGWAEHLGGPLAKLIIQQNGNAVGGLMLLGIDAHAHFYVTNEKAREFLQSVIDNANTTIIAGVSA